jgi:hypothetical protein
LNKQASNFIPDFTSPAGDRLESNQEEAGIKESNFELFHMASNR